MGACTPKEEALLQNGSKQSDLWGANFYPANRPDRRIEYSALINIRPQQENQSMEIEDPAARKKVKELLERILLSPDEDWVY